jgi:hypothetical protein
MPRIRGKLKSKSLKTDKFSVAKISLADLLKEESARQKTAIDTRF